jgi:hypothetical protein
MTKENYATLSDDANEAACADLIARVEAGDEEATDEVGLIIADA